RIDRGVIVDGLGRGDRHWANELRSGGVRDQHHRGQRRCRYQPPTKSIAHGTPHGFAHRLRVDFPIEHAHTLGGLPQPQLEKPRAYEGPCPSCAGFTEITWQHIEWEPDHPETAAFRCPHCRELIADTSRRFFSVPNDRAGDDTAIIKMLTRKTV